MENLITILQKTQDTYGYLPRSELKKIAADTGIPPAKVFGVATFYKQFRLQKVGKYELLICMGTACHVNGAGAIVETVTERLGISEGETTKDGLFTLTIVACLGCCSLAPVMMIKAGGSEEVYGNLTRAKVTKILDEISAREIKAKVKE